jgi:hypothetical protein
LTGRLESEFPASAVSFGFCPPSAEGHITSLQSAWVRLAAEANSQCKSPRSQFGPLMETQIKEQTNGLLMTWLEQIGSNPSPEIAATAASWAIYGLAQYWNEQKDRDSVDEYVEKILPLVEANLQLSRA